MRGGSHRRGESSSEQEGEWSSWRGEEEHHLAKHELEGPRRVEAGSPWAPPTATVDSHHLRLLNAAPDHKVSCLRAKNGEGEEGRGSQKQRSRPCRAVLSSPTPPPRVRLQVLAVTSIVFHESRALWHK